MSRMLFDRNPIAGLKRIWHTLADGTSVLQTQQDITEILEENAEMRKDRADHWREGVDPEAIGVHVAQIPMTVLMDLHRKGITRDQNELKRWLNDPDNEVFRTKKGRL